MLLSNSMISNTLEPLKPNNVVEKSDSESKSSRDFYKIAALGTAIGFGAAAASTASLPAIRVPWGFPFRYRSPRLSRICRWSGHRAGLLEAGCQQLKGRAPGFAPAGVGGGGLVPVPVAFRSQGQPARLGRGSHPGHRRPFNCRPSALAGETLPGFGLSTS